MSVCRSDYVCYFHSDDHAKLQNYVIDCKKLAKCVAAYPGGFHFKVIIRMTLSAATSRFSHKRLYLWAVLSVLTIFFEKINYTIHPIVQSVEFSTAIDPIGTIFSQIAFTLP